MRKRTPNERVVAFLCSSYTLHGGKLDYDTAAFIAENFRSLNYSIIRRAAYLADGSTVLRKHLLDAMNATLREGGNV
jgi:tetrahydrodipicolinate N-succinyltransferase